MKETTHQEFDNYGNTVFEIRKSSDCIYHCQGFCERQSPGTRCEIKDCYNYTTKVMSK